MAIPQANDKYLKQLQKLIALWENLSKAEPVESKKYYELYERSKTILDQLCPDSQAFLDKVNIPSRENIGRLIGKLRATLLDLQDGFLHFQILDQIQNELTVDLMQQAEELLTEGGTSTYGHIPAAVLAGVVLETFLRALCTRQLPPISLTLENGNLKTLATLVNDLEKAEFYNPAESKQIKVWVHIRNAAAHGQFKDFDLKQVEDMIKWIREFIEKHL